ncbi:GNAT family N-acetyltransferase [Marinilactibacillus psychrotolerans]|uniref:N-acetyltransferase n=1 Tax=Marinilactibacillus psychrotolerans TaxID=191770 RepID=A0AAV3WR21_9LACT|nr:GNAT family N-acetyltransferase [Marinilactibacillus psychrotolerans]GEL66771.1 N-acetyltransferase [Marinilactibacillus psychrotolerans]GEQ34332.1 N-acetyltransferase [Marinilactibacillus psychrotolerans]GEQ35782.1 N-acetyltransferase [Marinilactibacillus psychrotolerans]SDC33668.1 Acetyltransferase (GNAT) family protein [Marinilactibacillus psychrotolerans]
MIEMKRVGMETLDSMVEKVFAEQDIDHFGSIVETNKEKIAIGAYLDKKLVGGIVADKEYQTIHVSLLVITQDARGLSIGSKLLQEIETIAKEKGIIHITLTTRSYQAVDFYKKNGYTVFATLEDMPIEGVTKYYFDKRLK